MMETFKTQALINKLKAENEKLRAENKRLRDAGNPEKLAKFEKEKEQAILFCVKGIEERTMNAVRTQLCPTFSIHTDSLIVRAIQDCLRLSIHFMDPRRMTNLYSALKLANPNADGRVPSIDEVEELLKKHMSSTELNEVENLNALLGEDQ